MTHDAVLLRNDVFVALCAVIASFRCFGFNNGDYDDDPYADDYPSTDFI